ncbi:Lrp/AsnC family transcriptional regulator, partial [Cutibacterium acnes]
MTKITSQQLMEDIGAGLSNVEIARKHGTGESTVRERRAKLAKSGWSPEHDMTKTVPEPYMVKGTSTLYDKDGQQVLQWVKTSVDRETELALIQAAVEAACEDITPCAAVPLRSTSTHAD